MAEKSYTVEDVLRMIQIVKRDVEYLKTLETKWVEQKKRFPVIYEGILKQQDALRLKASKLRTMKVVLAAEEVEDLATQLLEGAPETPPEELKPEAKEEMKKDEMKPSAEKKSITDFAPAEVKPVSKAPDIGRGGPTKPEESKGGKESKDEKEDLALRRRRLGIRAR